MFLSLRLQQHLPFTVLKQKNCSSSSSQISAHAELQQHLPFTVLKLMRPEGTVPKSRVATALTVYGIETCIITLDVMNQPNKLQQHLPFTVLKRHHFERF